MQLSPRQLELHRQEQNLFQLIQLFKTQHFHLDDPQAELFWNLVMGVEAKVIQENNWENFPDIELIFFAIQSMKIDQGHPFHNQISEWLLLLPPFVNSTFNRWLLSQQQLDAPGSPVMHSRWDEEESPKPAHVSQSNSDKPFAIMGSSILLPGQFREEFVAQYNFLCESVGIPTPKVAVGESSLNITVPDLGKMETYTVLLESVLLEQKQKEELKEYTFRDFVLM